MSPTAEVKTPTTLDTLYRPGAIVAFRASLDLSSVIPGGVLTVKESSGDREVEVEVAWTVGEKTVAMMNVALHPTWIWYGFLWVDPEYQYLGVYQKMLEQRDLFASWGLATMVCYPGSAVAEEVLLQASFVWGQWEGAPRLVNPTTGGRASEYLAWKHGQGPEPPWRKAA